MDNRDPRPIDLEDLLSDPFDPAPPHPASDFSSWPAESSPAPGGDEGMDTDGSEMELSDEDFDDEGQNEEDYDGRDEDEDDEEESDAGETLEDAFLADGGVGDLDGFMDDFEFEFEPWAAGAHGRVEDDDEGLFVDQGPGFLPPLEEILSNVRRNHARALDLVSELHSESRQRATVPRPNPTTFPPPPAREGFTRDTGNDDNVIICPSCEEELKYDPDAGIDDSTRPAKKIRTRKDHEEHHFWALKDCGHVYCRNCYENRSVRKPTAKTPMTRFRRDPGPSVPPKKSLRPVDRLARSEAQQPSQTGVGPCFL
ncbi:hypothetical protein CHGG_05385 [Chaetomium globosum CBS 148.51]|uniref:RING-type domain-containing protein n=1 Tax=Chaetomium globosum (strain ATCC 6205 / CBS 148.51 / DSM 1962 / NBRC 6347 / NRRL 1970) TaxID=306901 RepID=Q2H7I0_CHAGB|nr:uncharacterized protein CHGG_05385 [Chaetomium globosum CBS 148.51]EAQ88766.1 hypothetical protein CHGG_05385 [Chaetomium globosum CBS 148.51]